MNLKQVLIIALCFVWQSALPQHSYVNQEWSTVSGLPINIHWSSSILASSGHLVTVGNTFTSGQSANVLLTKHAPDGTVMWQVEYDNPDNLEDYGIGLCEDASGNFLVIGTSYRSLSSSLDILALKFNAAGQLQWDYFYNGSANGDDIPSGVATDGQNLVLTGGTENAGSATDYITVKLKHDGTHLWTQLYDYNSLDDVAVKVNVDQGSGDIIVTGGSAEQLNLYDMVAVKYDANGNLVNTQRSNYNVGIDQPTCIGFDGNGNIIVGGYYVPTVNQMNLSTFSMDDTLGLNWNVLSDPTNGEDKIMDMVVTQAGEIYVAGHVEETAGYFKCYVAKYDQNGGMIWERSYQKPTGSSFGRRIAMDVNGNLNVTGMVYDGPDTNIVLLRYKPDGTLMFSQEYDAGGAEVASTIQTDLWGNIYIQGTTSVNGNGYVTVKYSVFDRSMDVVNDTVDTIDYIDNEIVIRFDPSTVNTNNVDDRGKTFGILSDFVSSSVIQDMNTLFGNAYDFGRFNTIKAFRLLTTADTISISRLGDTIEMPPFWATFVVQIPESMNDYQAAILLDTGLSPSIHYAELNYVGELTAFTNDSLFQSGEFIGFHDTISAGPLKSDINMPEAWDMEVGNSATRVGIYDTGINWAHPDFSKTGSLTFQDSKIIDGWSIGNNTHISNGNPDSLEHGTWVSGIIGAIRNNNMGVPGVAGGDMTSSNAGASLIVMQEDGPTNAQEVGEWIIYGAKWNPGASDPGYRMHVQNHSWKWQSDATLIWEAVNFCAHNAVVFVAASGNEGNTDKNFPSSYKDEWVLKTGASDATGRTASFTTYGHDLDFIAPGTSELYKCVAGIGQGYKDSVITSQGLEPINGSSFAAPHVSGVAALFQSYAHYNNLDLFAPEDIEHFLQIKAKDIDDITPYTPGWDAKSGWGRVQADDALASVKHPKYEVKHVSVALPVIGTQVGTLEFRYFERGFGSVNAGYYFVNIYEVTQTVNHNIGSKTLLEAWKRDGASNLWGYAANFGDTIVPEPDITLVSYNSTSATLKGYYYDFILGSSSTATMPIISLGTARFAYTLHLDDESINDLGDEQKIVAEGVSIYPNPGSDVQYISLNDSKSRSIDIRMYDINGRMAKFIHSGPVSSGKLIPVDVTQLESGIYVYEIRSGSNVTHAKTIISH